MLASIVRSLESVEYLRILRPWVSSWERIWWSPPLHCINSMTSSSTTTWDMLIFAFPTLYKDLTNVQTDLLLDLTKPALSFVSEQRFKDCLYPSDLLKPTVCVIEQFRPEITAVLNVLLPRLTKGWAR